MTAYTFYVYRSNFEATMTINLYGIILWQMETYFVNKKREILTIYRLWLSRRRLMVPYKLLGAYQFKENIFDILKKRQQYYTHARLFFHTLQMCKNLNGENLANFLAVINFAKFSWHQSIPSYGMYPATFIIFTITFLYAIHIS